MSSRTPWPLLCLAACVLAGCAQRPPPTLIPAPVFEPQVMPPVEEPEVLDTTPSFSAPRPAITPRVARPKRQPDHPAPAIRPRAVEPVQPAPLTDPTTY